MKTRVTAFVAAFMLSLGCGDDDSGSLDAGVPAVVDDVTGASGAPCYPNDTCNKGLSCVRKVCVADDGGTMRMDGGAGGTGGTGGPDASTGSVDAGSNSDGGMSSDPCDANGGGCSSSVKRVFTTKEHYPPDLKTAGKGKTGLGGADNICNTTADAAGLGGKWKAWLSDSSEDAIDRIADVGPWYLVDGVTKVFNSKKNLAGSPLVPINTDENGVALVEPGTPDTGQVQVWTGSSWGGANDNDGDGGIVAAGTCSDWMGVAADDISKSGLVGNWKANSAAWTDDRESLCVLSFSGAQYYAPEFHLYCFEQ